MSQPYLTAWRAQLDDSSRLFGALYLQDAGISLAYGVVAGALLWPLRDDHDRPPASDLLAAITGDPKGLHEAIAVMHASGPLAGAQHLTRSALERPDVRNALDALLDHFRDDWLRLGLLKPAPVTHVTGSVEGANVVIGGTQYVGGDLVVLVTRPRTRTCPSAPNPPAHFAGRRRELAQLKHVLERGGNVAITGVHGMGGIGKTALAQQLATELDGFGAVLWASLGPAPSVVNHLVGWARHDDPQFEAGDSPVDVLAERVNASLTALVREHCPGRALVILDDVWEGDSVTAARTLQRAAPRGAACLITTRSQRVVAQLRSTGLDLRTLEPAEALEMLRKLLTDLPELASEDLLALADVTGHHPLALELAAGQVRLFERPELEVAGLIEQYRGGIPAGSPFRDIRLELGEAREDNLELVLSFSYERLDEQDRARFRALGALAPAASFDRSLVSALWELEEPRPALDTLRHSALLTLAPEPGWYLQHPLLRAYGRALLVVDADELAAAEERYADEIAGVAEHFGALPHERWDALEPYIPHVEEAGRHVVAAARRPQAPERALERGLAFALGTSHLLASRRELRHPEWLELGLAISRRRMDVGHTVTFLDELGLDRILHGDVKGGMAFLDEAADAARRSGDRAGLARTWLLLGGAVLHSDPDVAPRYLRDAANQFEQLGDDAGRVAALLRLAEWSALGFQEVDRREWGLTTAIQARDLAPTAAAAAEAELVIGRLQDQLGRREEAVEPLAAAVERFKALRMRRREGVARLQLASAHANLGAFDAAEEQLLEALPLLRATGDVPALATALRNLAELEARRRRPGRALERFAEALPLVRRQTMRFLNEDDEESTIAVPFFSAQLETVAMLDQVEAARARLPLDEPVHGSLPDELLRYLAVGTVHAAGEEWAEALTDFDARVEALGSAYAGERRLVHALIALTRGDAPPDGVDDRYVPLVAQVAARIERGAAPLLSDEEASFYTSNTLAALLGAPGERRQWALRLRRDRRVAHQLGDEHEVALLEALLALLAGRLGALRHDNPYQPRFRELQTQLLEYQAPLDGLLVEGTVAVRTVLPQQRDAWTGALRERRLEAVRHGDADARVFVEGLIALSTGAQPEPPPGNPYRPQLELAAEAIAAGHPMELRIPPTHLENTKNAVLRVLTQAPKSVELVARTLAEQGTRAQHFGRLDEPALYAALIQLMTGERPRLPAGNVYAEVLDEIAERARRAPAVSDRDDALPDREVDELVVRVSAALTDEPERAPAVRDDVARFGARCKARGRAWKQERTFADALVALLEGRRPDVRASGRYDEAVARVIAAVERFEAIRAAGGNLAPQRLEWILHETANALRNPREIVDEQLNSEEGFMAAYTDSRLHDAVVEQQHWTQTLADLRAEFVAGGPSWRHEVALADALLTALDWGDPRLDADNPYAQPVAEMLEAVGHAPGVFRSDSLVKAMALDEEAHAEHFIHTVTGRAQFRADLDKLLALVVGALTVQPDNVARVGEAVAQWRGLLQERVRGDVGALQELDLLAALTAVLDGARPVLPADHAYARHVRSVLESVALFHSPPTPGRLPAEWIARICIVTPGVLTIGRQHFAAFRQEMLELRAQMAQLGPAGADAEALLAAILIVLEGRPADLPLDNSYRPYLELAQMQLRALRRQATVGAHGPTVA